MDTPSRTSTRIRKSEPELLEEGKERKRRGKGEKGEEEEVKREGKPLVGDFRGHMYSVDHTLPEPSSFLGRTDRKPLFCSQGTVSFTQHNTFPDILIHTHHVYMHV